MDREGSGKLRARGEDGHQDRPSLTTNEVFEILKNERRRTVLRYLREHDGYAELSDIAEHIAAAENDTTVQQLTSQERKRVHVALYQCHLPKMDRHGVIEYDKDRGTIELLDSVSEMESYLDLDPADASTDTRSDRIVVAFVVVVVTLVTAGTLGLGSLSAVSPAGWTLVSVLAIVVIAGRQYRG